MSLPDQTGQRVPYVEFNVRDGYRWVSKTTDDYFKQKRVVVFALPGAFTPTCSSVHLPRFNELSDDFRENGIDDVICLSVNDSFVMNEWRKTEKADQITMLPDGNGEFSEKMGLLVEKFDLCFGRRSWRYAMVVNDGVIEKMFLEPEEEGDPYGASSAENVLRYLNPDYRPHPSITIFTREGCSFCARAKELLAEKGLRYEELTLNREFSIKTVKALSGTTKLPQVFLDGEKIGGAEDLETYFRNRPATGEASTHRMNA